MGHFVYDDRELYSLEQEQLWEDLIRVLQLLAIILCVTWMDFIYEVFLHQQLEVPRKVATGMVSRKFASRAVRMYLLAFSACALCLPSYHTDIPEYSWDDFKIFPERILWLILFAAISLWNLLTCGSVDRIVEIPVLKVMWPVYIFGLALIILVTRLGIYLTFQKMWEPTVSHRRDSGSKLWPNASFFLLAVPVFTYFLFSTIAYWNLPNFIYR